jgi:Ni,Fe-hydrogenase maturation factor
VNKTITIKDLVVQLIAKCQTEQSTIIIEDARSLTSEIVKLKLIRKKKYKARCTHISNHHVVKVVNSLTKEKFECHKK